MVMHYQISSTDCCIGCWSWLRVHTWMATRAVLGR